MRISKASTASDACFATAVCTLSLGALLLALHRRQPKRWPFQMQGRVLLGVGTVAMAFALRPRLTERQRFVREYVGRECYVMGEPSPNWLTLMDKTVDRWEDWNAFLAKLNKALKTFGSEELPQARINEIREDVKDLGTYDLLGDGEIVLTLGEMTALGLPIESEPKLSRDQSLWIGLVLKNQMNGRDVPLWNTLCRKGGWYPVPTVSPKARCVTFTEAYNNSKKPPISGE